jgi:hypothetical protein
VSAPVDLALIGGLSLLVFAAYQWGGIGAAGPRAAVAALVPIFVNWPHFAATNTRLYGSRSSMAQYPITSIAAPLVVCGAVTASLLSPLLVAPVFLKMFMIWSPFHYCGQTLGVGLLYARRARFRVDAFTRWALVAFVYLSYVSQSAFAEVAPTGSLYFGVRLPTFGLAAGIPILLRNVMYLCGCLAILALAIAALAQRRLPPLGLLVAPLTQYVWFVPGADVPGFRELVPAFHGLQYLLVAGAMQFGQRDGASFPAARLGRWMAINVALGAALFALLPRLPRSLGFAEPLLAAGVITAGIQIHHFFVDGVIWKLRSPSVSRRLGADLDPRPVEAPRALPAPMEVPT